MKCYDPYENYSQHNPLVLKSYDQESDRPEQYRKRYLVPLAGTIFRLVMWSAISGLFSLMAGLIMYFAYEPMGVLAGSALFLLAGICWVLVWLEIMELWEP